MKIKQEKNGAQRIKFRIRKRCAARPSGRA